jgi:hypothetical protein
MTRPLKVLLPIKNIPDGSRVTKPNGQKPYIVRSSIKIYTTIHGGDRVIEADHGTRFILPEGEGQGSINAVSGDAEHLWHTTVEDFHQYLSGILEDDDEDLNK